MKRLSTKEHWDSQYANKTPTDPTGPAKNDTTAYFANSGLRQALRKYLRSYSDFYTWDILYKRFLPKGDSVKAIEVGSAPGEHLIRLSEELDIEPFGVEYSEAGAKLNKQNFRLNNLNPDNVIQADFFSNDFQNRYRGYFDVVISRGFIEHFDNVEEVVRKHVNILKPGGSLVVSIPNFRGMNFLLLKFFNRSMIDIHNLDIMNKKEFSSLFDETILETQFVDYFGGINFWLLGTRENSKKLLLKMLFSIQKLLDLLMNLLLRGKRPGSSHLFSPYLLYLGKKKG